MDFVFTLPNGRLWALLHVFWWATKIWATTGRMLFYLLCKIVANFYINIRKEVEFIASNNISSNGKLIPGCVAADRITKLANLHALVYQCVEQLNVHFGHFLLIEISFIFLTEINTAMYTLEALFSEPVNWLHALGNLTLVLYWLLNFSIICISSYQIESEVIKFQR